MKCVEMDSNHRTRMRRDLQSLVVATWLSTLNIRFQYKRTGTAKPNYESGIRTHVLRRMRPTIWPLIYLVLNRLYRIRTYDPLLVRQVFSHWTNNLSHQTHHAIIQTARTVADASTYRFDILELPVSLQSTRFKDRVGFEPTDGYRHWFSRPAP